MKTATPIQIRNSKLQSTEFSMNKIIFVLCLAMFILAIAGACSILPSSEPATESPEPFPIIDMHMHTYQWNKYGDPPQPNLITGNIPEARTDAEAIDAYVTEMERFNIVLASWLASLHLHLSMPRMDLSPWPLSLPGLLVSHSSLALPGIPKTQRPRKRPRWI